MVDPRRRIIAFPSNIKELSQKTAYSPARPNQKKIEFTLGAAQSLRPQSTAKEEVETRLVTPERGDKRKVEEKPQADK